ncbi:hypothetical protein QZH41_003309 [Actinostola sp. cb2023]|nr:hypothetical protein QZH41_003309 [Actinostola sp. cb2023]
MDEEEFYYFDELTDDLDLANAAKTYEEQMTGKEKDDEDDEMINSILQAQKSRNTEYKTKSDMKTWKRFCQSNEEERKMEDIPSEELNKLFCKLFISVRKQDGGEYEPGTLSGFQRSFQRYLQEKGSSYNILKDNEFSKSRNVIAAKRKNLTHQGKGNRPNATRELTKAEEDTLFESGQLSIEEPKALQKALWWFLSLHFAWRARDESRKLSWEDVSLENDPETGDECLIWKTEKGSKTRTGQKGGHQRAFEPKAYAITNKSRCPVEFYKVFRSHRPQSMLAPDSPFYLAINHRRKPEDEVWYLDRPLGKNEIGKFLKESAEAARLNKNQPQGHERKLTNHSVRKTSIGRLLDANVEANYVAQLSGHKNLKSLDSYKSASLKNQRSMSAILSNNTPSFSRDAATSIPSSTVTVMNQSASSCSYTQNPPQAIFSGATIDKIEGCSFNVNVIYQQSTPQNPL